MISNLPQSGENYSNVDYVEPLHRTASKVGGPTLTQSLWWTEDCVLFMGKRVLTFFVVCNSRRGGGQPIYLVFTVHVLNCTCSLCNSEGEAGM